MTKTTSQQTKQQLDLWKQAQYIAHVWKLNDERNKGVKQ